VRDLSIYKDNFEFEKQVLAVYEKVVKGALAEKEVSFV
jgi:putative transposon-encoded protein